MENDRFNQDINKQMQKLQKAERSHNASLNNINNIKQAVGENFEESKENYEI